KRVPARCDNRAAAGLHRCDAAPRLPTLLVMPLSNGLVRVESPRTADETVERLRRALDTQKITLFGLIIHSGEGNKVGLTMRPTKVLVFGSPKAGTPLMLAAPTIAIDLPLKILVWEDAAGRVWMAYNSPEYLGDRHDLPRELFANISVVAKLAA